MGFGDLGHRAGRVPDPRTDRGAYRWVVGARAMTCAMASVNEDRPQ